MKRRNDWFGWKRPVKAALMLRPVNAMLVTGARLLLTPASARRLPVNRPEVAGLINGTHFVMLNPAMCTVAKELFWGGGRRPRDDEHLALKLVTELCYQADVLLDIGAYSGVFTLAACKRSPTLRAHAFEIVPDVYKLLFDNCVRNDILSRVTCHHEGLGVPNASVVLPAQIRASSLPTSMSSETKYSSGVKVSFSSLDSMTQQIAAGVRVVAKIDLEGTENAMFEHGQHFLNRFKPDMLCEVLASRARPRRLEALLRSHGYQWYLVSDSAIVAHHSIVPHPKHRDWLFSVRSVGELAKVVSATGATLVY